MNLKSIFKFLSFFVFVYLFFAGCKKDAGEGGTSFIKGRVIVHKFDAAFQETVPDTIYNDADEDTYIIYGADHSTYDNNYKTTYDGTYTFQYLQKGTYRIFAYSMDTSGAKNTGVFSGLPIPVFVDVEITSNGSTVTAPDIIVLKNKF